MRLMTLYKGHFGFPTDPPKAGGTGSPSGIPDELQSILKGLRTDTEFCTELIQVMQKSLAYVYINSQLALYQPQKAPPTPFQGTPIIFKGALIGPERHLGLPEIPTMFIYHVLYNTCIYIPYILCHLLYTTLGFLWSYVVFLRPLRAPVANLLCRGLPAGRVLARDGPYR